MNALIAGAIVRALIQLAAGAGVVLADDAAYQIAAGLVALGTLIWSIIQKWRAEKKTTPQVPPLVIVAFIALSFSLSGCAGMTQNDCMSKVAATEIAVTQGYQTTTRLLTSGTISKAVAKTALTTLDAANASVDNAAPLCKMKDPKAADYLLHAAGALAQFAAITGGK